MAAKPKPTKETAEKTTELDECFIIMPISDPEGYDSGHFKHVYDNIIKPACKKADYKAYRADDNESTNMIHDVILKKILNAPMAVCDLSSLNPNVMFELGIRQAFDKPVVLIQEKGTKRVFDLAPIKTIEYPKGMVYHEVIAFQEKLSIAIKSTFEESSKPDNSNSIVKFLALQSAARIPDISGNEESMKFNILQSEMSEIRHLLKMNLSNNSNIPALPPWERNSSNQKVFRISRLERDFTLMAKANERKELSSSQRSEMINSLRIHLEEHLTDPDNPEDEKRAKNLHKHLLNFIDTL